MKNPEISPRIESNEEGVCVYMPNSNLREWIDCEGGSWKLTGSYQFNRLHGIRQLSILSDCDNNGCKAIFEHTRAWHSLTTAKLNEKVLIANNATDEQIRIGILGGILHDIAMPAGGDATKILNREKLEEEDFWNETIGLSGNTVNAIDEVIKNKGILGIIQDINDRISYTFTDLFALGKEFNGLDIVMKKYPYLGDIYKDIEIDWQKEEVYFINPDRLGSFLKIRAILNSNVYRQEINQLRDLKFVSLIRPFFSEDENKPEEILTPKKLRRMTDNQLMEYLATKYKTSEVLFLRDLTNWKPEHILTYRLDQNEEVVKKAEELKNNGKRDVFIAKNEGFKTAVNYLVKTKNGESMKYEEYNPKSAKEINNISEASKKIVLCYSD